MTSGVEERAEPEVVPVEVVGSRGLPGPLLANERRLVDEPDPAVSSAGRPKRAVERPLAAADGGKYDPEPDGSASTSPSSSSMGGGVWTTSGVTIPVDCLAAASKVDDGAAADAALWRSRSRAAAADEGRTTENTESRSLAKADVDGCGGGAGGRGVGAATVPPIVDDRVRNGGACGTATAAEEAAGAALVVDRSEKRLGRRISLPPAAFREEESVEGSEGCLRV